MHQFKWIVGIIYSFWLNIKKTSLCFRQLFEPPVSKWLLTKILSLYKKRSTLLTCQSNAFLFFKVPAWTVGVATGLRIWRFSWFSSGLGVALWACYKSSCWGSFETFSILLLYMLSCSYLPRSSLTFSCDQISLPDLVVLCSLLLT